MRPMSADEIQDVFDELQLGSDEARERFRRFATRSPSPFSVVGNSDSTVSNLKSVEEVCNAELAPTEPGNKD
jgi:hypothetical protein